MAARTILITGKGGVGKTSIAAATARRCAAAGLRTVVISTDPAHSLADVLGEPLGPRPVAVAEGLEAAEVSARDALERNWAGVRAWLGEALVRRGVDRISAEELSVPPGLDELFSLLELRRLQEREDVDCIVVDCAPTGETLRLLSFPDVAHWWLERVAPRQGRLLDAARPVARAMLDVALPGEEVLDEVARLMESLVALNTLLRDHRRVSVRLVLTPEQMVLAETRRTFTYLNLYGFQTDAVIVNRVFPGDVGPYFDQWRGHQEELVAQARAAFSPVPVLTAPYFPQEVRGPEMLDRLGDRAFAEVDVAAVLHDGVSERLQVGEDEASLRLDLPFARKGDVTVKRLGRELIVRVADHKRTIILPPALDAYRPAGAALEDGALTVSLLRG